MRFLSEKNKKRLQFLACGIGTVIFLKWILPICWPLVIALLLIAPIYDVLWKIERKTHIQCGILTGIFIVVGCGVILVALGGLIYGVFRICVEQIGGIGDIKSGGMHCVDVFCEGFATLTKIPKESVGMWVEKSIAECMTWIQGECLPSLLQKGLSSFHVIIGGSAVVLITSVMMILLAREYPQWRTFFYQQEIAAPAIRMCKRLKEMGGAYIKAQGIILGVITLLVTIGMFLIGSKHPVFYGVLAGVLDFFPFIGTGIVILPNALWQIFQGEYGRAIVLGLLYGSCVLAREFLEPKLLGNGMKVSPVLILLSVYAGLRIYGVSGIVLGPLTLIILLECYREINRKEERNE